MRYVGPDGEPVNLYEKNNGPLAARAPDYSRLLRAAGERLDELATRHSGPDWRENPDMGDAAAVLSEINKLEEAS